jgi:PAS domain S-box-containing protein
MDETRRFLELADLLPDALLLVSRDGVIRAANRGVRSRLEMSPEAMRGSRLAEIVTDPPDAVARYLRDWSRTRELLPGSLTVLRDGGEGIVCRAEGALYRPAGGDGDEQALLLLRLLPKEASVYRFLLLNQRIEDLNREIARRKRTESELREQREWLRVTLESIGDAVIATDMDGCVSFLNPVAEELTGWQAAEAVGRPLREVFDIVNEETRRPAENPVNKVLREGVLAGLANHTILVSRNGREIPIDDCAAPILDGRGELLGVVMVFHDITERRDLERELTARAARLAEADRRKDEFLAMLAHELRNPLAPIRNALHLLGVPGARPADFRRAREMMERQVQHMVRLVDDLLDVSRITRGKVRLRLERVEVSALIQRAAEAVRPHMEAKRHRFRVSLPPEPILLHADPTRLDQVLLNLLNNAAKFTEPGGRIELDASREGDGVRISVRDTGIGIDPELLPRIFDPFMQGDQSLDRSQGGLGIGLTLARSLVEMHGGTLTAFSDGPGRGSELVVCLPARGETPEGTGAGDRDGEREAGRPGLRVLVVDDNRDSAESIALLAEIWGHEVLTAHDGPSALETAAAHRPDVVLLDIGLPGMDGYEVARRLREGRGEGEMVLIAMTGYGMEEDRRRSREAGFDHHLVKPVDPEALRSLLASF